MQVLLPFSGYPRAYGVRGSFFATVTAMPIGHRELAMYLPKLLNELRVERRLLHDVITALEIASASPPDGSSEELMSEIEACQSGRGLLMLGRRRKARMSRLARRVTKSVGKQSVKPRRTLRAQPPQREGPEIAKVIAFVPAAQYRQPAA